MAGPSPDSAPPTWQGELFQCPICGTIAPLTAVRCARCGSELPGVAAVVRMESAHISYLLRQLPHWRAQGLLSAEAEAQIIAGCRARQEELRSISVASQAAVRGAPSSPASANAAGTEESRGAAIPVSSAPSPSPIPSQMDFAFVDQGQSRPAASKAPQPGALQRLLHEHGLKIVFALATLFVLAALRSILAWPWLDAMAVKLLPGAPLGLMTMFWWFGRKTRQENPWASFVYDGLATALLAFSAYAINSYWLQGALPPKGILLVASAASTGAAGAMLISRRQLPYLHLTQTGMFVLLYALLQLARIGAAMHDLSPLPVLLFSSSYLLYGALCLLMARQANDRPVRPVTARSKQPDAGAATPPGRDRSSRIWQAAWTLWSHLAIAAAGVLAAIALTLQAARPDDFALLALLAGVIYAAGAQLLGQPRMVYLATGFMVCSALFRLASHPLWNGLAGFDLLLLAFSALALVMAAFNSRLSNRNSVTGSLARAYEHIAGAGVLLATLIAWSYAISLGSPAAPGPSPAHALTGALLAAGCGAFHLLFAVRERRPVSAYLTLICAGLASALLMRWLLPPAICTPAVCLIPFMVISAGLALFLSRGEEIPSVEAKALWSEPVARTTLAALLIGAGEWLYRLVIGAEISGWIGWVLPVLISALLLALSRPLPQRDVLRSMAIGTLCLTAALEVAAVCGLPGGLPFGSWRPEKAHAFGYGLALLGWAWWIVSERARGRYAAWNEDLERGGLATAFGSILMLLWGPGPRRIMEHDLVLFDACLAGVFALFALDSYRRQHRATSVGALLVFLLAGLASLLKVSPGSPFAAPVWTLLALAAAGVFLLLGRRLDDPGIAGLSAAPLLAGYGLFALWQMSPALSTFDAISARALWVAGGGALAWGWLRAARWSERSEFSYSAGALLIGCYLRAITLCWHPSAVWHALLLLPCLAALYIYSDVAARRSGFPNSRMSSQGEQRPHTPGDKMNAEKGAPKDGARNESADLNLVALIGLPLQRVAFVASALALVWSGAWGDGLIFRHATPWPVTLTLAIYGAVYMALAFVKPSTITTAACSLTLTAAYLHLLLQYTALFHPVGAALSWPYFSFLAIQAGLFWLSIGWRLRLRRAELVQPLLILAGGVGLLSTIVGLLTVQTPHEGRWTLLTLAWNCAIWLGLWLLEQGEICLHVGIWNLLIDWMLILDDRYGLHLALMDLYLLPVGLYLITIGHLASRQRKSADARPLWWAGLLLILTPAFYATWEHIGSPHTILFVLECSLAVLWGVMQRIRAFVSAGLAFAVLFAASVTVGRLPDMWGALTALLIGILLFVAGFYVLTHRAVVQRWAAMLERQWQAWLSWR